MKKTLLMVILAVVLGISIANAGPVFYNTGVDNSGNQLSGGSSDPHYMLRQVTSGTFVGDSNWAPAVAMGASRIYHGHTHDSLHYKNAEVQMFGVGLCGITSLDGTKILAGELDEARANRGLFS